MTINLCSPYNNWLLNSKGTLSLWDLPHGSDSHSLKTAFPDPCVSVLLISFLVPLVDHASSVRREGSLDSEGNMAGLNSQLKASHIHIAIRLRTKSQG